MQLLSQLLALPPPLLLVFMTSSFRPTHAIEWPYNLPAHQKYWPEHEQFMKRDIEIGRRLATETPLGVRKMSEDPNEMFFLEYWQFPRDDEEGIVLGKERRHWDGMATSDESVRQRHSHTMSSNSTILEDFLAPFLLHSGKQSPLPRGFLNTRSYQCPTGTNSCQSIQRPNSCCPTDEDCVIIPRTNELGDVGCCPKGKRCGGPAIGCDTAHGYSSCPGSINGGCCIPNYVCDGVGCIYESPATITTRETVAPVTVSQETPIVETSTVYTTLSATISVIGVLTVTNFASTITLPIIGPTTCKAGFQSCPASLDGGCCRNGNVCESGGYCRAVSTEIFTATITPNAPIRPTIEGQSSVNALTTTTVFPSVCPTGYYQCSAYYPGGCCQVGRDCASTDCPITSAQTIITSAVTVVAPGSQGSSFVIIEGSTVTTTSVTQPTGPVSQGGCAAGWFLCGSGSSECCPNNYVCGSDSTCTNDGLAQGPGKVKEVPVGKAYRVESLGKCIAGLAVVIGLGMIYL